jgi:hypothetical protein
MSNDIIEERELMALTQLCGQIGLDALCRDLAAAKQFSTVGGVRVAVAGLVKRGKSSLVNAIIGEELSPVNLLPETSSVLCFVRSEPAIAHGVSFDGKFRKLSPKPNSFLADVSREARKPLLAATYSGALSLPDDFCLVDTPGAHEAEVTMNSMMDSGMPSSLFDLCDGFIVVLGVPGVSATDIQLLEQINSSASGSPVRILLKGLDSGISYLDLREYASEVLDGCPNEIFVIADDNKSELTTMMNSFRSISPRTAQVANLDSQRIIQSVKKTILSVVQNRDEVNAIAFPSRLLKDLPEDLATLVARFAPGERERRIAELQKSELRAKKEAFRVAFEAWSLENDRLSQNLVSARHSLSKAQADMKNAKPKIGCGSWILMGLSFAFFPIGPIIMGVVMWVAYGKEESDFDAVRPSIYGRITQSTEAIDRAQRLLDLHLQSKPKAP